MYIYIYISLYTLFPFLRFTFLDVWTVLDLQSITP